jgi:hypothetical protein
MTCSPPLPAPLPPHQPNESILREDTASAAVGQLTSDGAGNFTAGSQTVSQNGIISGQTFTGTYSVSAKCIGSLTLNISGGGISHSTFVADNADRDRHQHRCRRQHATGVDFGTWTSREGRGFSPAVSPDRLPHARRVLCARAGVGSNPDFTRGRVAQRAGSRSKRRASAPWLVSYPRFAKDNPVAKAGAEHRSAWSGQGPVPTLNLPLSYGLSVIPAVFL